MTVKKETKPKAAKKTTAKVDSKTFKFPKQFTYKRSIDVTNGYMYQAKSLDPDAMTLPLSAVSEKALGTHNNISDREKIKKEEAEGKNKTLNPQEVEVVHLNHGFDFLKVTYSIFPTSFYADPYTCNDQESLRVVNSFIEQMVSKGAIKELADLYVENVITGRWFWRNDLGQKTVRIEVTTSENPEPQHFEFKSFIEHYVADDVIEIKGTIDELTALFRRALEDKNFHVELNVTGYVKIKEGKEVYPSQVFLSDGSPKGGKNSRIFQKERFSGSKHEHIVYITDRKINNAIRTIDKWHSAGFAIAVNAFGACHKTGKNIRSEENNDFYTLVENNICQWITQLEKVDSVNECKNKGDMLFVLGNFIRGGVYNGA